MNRNIYLVSVGIGEPDLITLKGKRILEKMDIIAGFPQLKDFAEGKPFYEVKSIEELEEVIKKHSDKKIGVIVSGDAGFFSFAKKIYETLNDYLACVVPGVSTFQYALSRIRQTYEEVKFFSFHTKCENLEEIFRALTDREKKIFLLLKDSEQLKELKEAIKGSGGKVTYFGDLNTKDEVVTEDLDEILTKGCKKISLFWRKDG